MFASRHRSSVTGPSRQPSVSTNRHGPSMHTVPMSTRSSVRGSGHEASKAKRGVSRPSSREKMRVMFPEPELWANIVRDCKLTDAQANKLEITLQEALDDIDRYYSKPQNRPRDVLVKHLKRFEKSLKRLRNECRHSAELME